MAALNSAMPVQNASWLDWIYNIAFRLTGQHQKAAALVRESMSGLATDNYSQIVIKNLCAAFLNLESRNKAYPVEKYQLIKMDLEKVQQALLRLPAPERLVIVLRETAGFSPSRVAELTGLEKEQVSTMLASGRNSLVAMLVGPRGNR